MTQTLSESTERTLLALVMVCSISIVGWCGYQLYKTWAPERAAEPQGHTTRILTWWGYLDNLSKRQEIEALCDTHIQVVDYTSPEDLLGFAAVTPYDLYIYPWGYQRYLEPHFKQPGPKINWMVDNYHPVSKDKYYQYNTPEDTVYFQHGVIMFVYDQDRIADLNNLTAAEIIKLSRTNTGRVFMPYFLTEIDWLIKHLPTGTPKDNWTELYQQFRVRKAWDQTNHSGLRISSFASDYFKPNANPILGLLESGEAMNPHFDWSTIKDPFGRPKAMKLGMHPTLSSAGTDVLTLKSHDPRHQCVAQAMGSREFLRWIAETNFYFSPFEEHIDSLPEALQRLTQEFYDKADTIPWLYDKNDNDPPSAEAEVIWRILRACEGGLGCEEWAAIGDKVFAGST